MTTMKKEKKSSRDLVNGPILSSLLIFAIPIVLTNVVQQLYTMVDLAVIGQYVGTVGTVAVNTGSEVADILSPVAMGFATAGQIYIAQLVGAGQESKTKKTIGTLLSFMIVLSLVLTVVSFLFAEPILQLLNCPEESLNDAIVYMRIVSLGTVFVFGYNAVCGILRGMGDSSRPLIFIIVAAIVNIVLDYVLVAFAGMDSAGTAIATTASQAASFIAAFWYLYANKEKFEFSLSLSYFKIDGPILWILIKLGIPQVVRSLCVRVGTLWVNSQANSYGLTVSGANSVGNKLQKFLDVFVSGVDTASAAMIGQNLGANKVDRAGKVTIYTLLSCLVAATGCAAVCIFLPEQVFGIFSTDADVIALGVVYLRIFVIHFYASAVVGSFQAMVTGCGFVELGFVLGVLDGIICKIGLSLFFASVLGMGYEGLWLGVACSRIPNIIITIGYYVSGKWKTKKLLEE